MLGYSLQAPWSGGGLVILHIGEANLLKNCYKIIKWSQPWDRVVGFSYPQALGTLTVCPKLNSMSFPNAMHINAQHKAKLAHLLTLYSGS